MLPAPLRLMIDMLSGFTRSSAVVDKPPDAMLLRRSGNSLIGRKGGYFLCPVSAIPATRVIDGRAQKMAAFSTFWFPLDTPHLFFRAAKMVYEYERWETDVCFPHRPLHKNARKSHMRL